MSVRETLERLLAGEDLPEAEAEALVVALTGADLHPAQAGAVLAALRAKGASATEIRGFAAGMHRLARKPSIAAAEDCVDVVGTGGDGSGSLNLSTGSALLAAAAGARVVKHGNRSVSSRCGSADVLEALGLGLPLDEAGAADLLEACGFTFLFAPYYHPALKQLAPIRAALGVRTVFNIMGPLVNPAAPGYGVIGAYSEETARLMAQTLAGMPIRRMFTVHGEPGWDEATPVGPFLLLDVRPGRVEETRIDPADLGIARCAPADLEGGDAAHNAERLTAVLTGAERGPARDALVLGAALALVVSGRAAGFEAGLTAAAAAIDSGHAARLLERLAAA
jgi:anthranilate phosphoribosyltransferase